ncbi:MAG: GNAT family N-acetyltransferase [Acidimicrobiia bacterium]|jgi:GNAT superfamily N-acetyltransferase
MRFLRTDSIHRWTEGDYTVTTDRDATNLDMVYRFLMDESYWWGGRPRAALEHVVEHSRPYTLRHDPTGEAVGFARVVTDGSWFAWIGDVLVLPEHRGGRGQFLLRCVMEDLEPVRRVSLGTRDAHDFYARFGFRAGPEYVGRSMERIDDSAGT